MPDQLFAVLLEATPYNCAYVSREKEGFYRPASYSKGEVLRKQPAVIFDMDGTLADCRHRLHLLEGPGKKNWDMFFDGSKDDNPRLQIFRLAIELSFNNAIVIASGRPERLRRTTEVWLKKFQLPYAEIYLRQNDDRRPDGLVKAEMLAFMKADGFEPWLAVDDRDTAVAAWRELGLCCLQCDQSRY